MGEQGKRLNQTEYCDFCGLQVNPYVVEDKPQKPAIDVRCPNCSHAWKVDRNEVRSMRI
jgi:hypothetical protein